MTLTPGTFIRVRADHSCTARAGMDGVVWREPQDGSVGLVFGKDRYGVDQGGYCPAPERWRLDELALETAY